ncbi:hypothetical protein KJ652_02660 [Patescibacteria group bacterium]|nr:hypothetical protein [Patescibacteria group bacterium]MBU1123468.1 hypothetical protein [Patescibacteria group bacterium]MBU1911842.1 hypothetical protein [Patescibacteria group bacterium]
MFTIGNIGSRHRGVVPTPEAAVDCDRLNRHSVPSAAERISCIWQQTLTAARTRIAGDSSRIPAAGGFREPDAPSLSTNISS